MNSQELTILHIQKNAIKHVFQAIAFQLRKPKLFFQMTAPETIRVETLLSLFTKLSGNLVPLRVDRSLARVMVNRKSDKLFDRFLDGHSITEFSYGKNGKREYTTLDLASACLDEFQEVAGKVNEELYLPLFASLFGRSFPARMDRIQAKLFVNRKSDSLFDQFVRDNGIVEATYSKSEKREYYTVQLGAATITENDRFRQTVA